MLFNSGLFNSDVFNGLDSTEITPSWNLLIIKQRVGLVESGNLLVLKQEVTQQNIGLGNLLTFTQRVNAIALGNLLTISQIVSESGTINPNPDSPIPHYIVRNGFYPQFIIGNYVWPDSQIHDSFRITGNENEGRQLVFTLLIRKNSPVSNINFEDFDGAPVSLTIYFLNGSIQPIFTGKINKVDIDLLKGSMTCTCDDNRREKIINGYYYQTQNIGYYDKDVQGQASDTFDLLDKRLQTVPFAVDVDRFGLVQLSNILPKTSPDLTFTDEDVYANTGEKTDPRVEKLLRSRVVNSVNIAINYQYQRRYHGEATFRWNWNTDVCTFLLEGESLVQRATVEAAAKGTGWVINNPGISYTEPPANGLYHCAGFPVAIPYSSVQLSGVTYQDKKDVLGNVINGTDGKPVKESVGGVYQDSRKLLATGAEWRMSSRWTQNVKETYNITLMAPQSVAQYGLVQESLETGIDDSADNGEWEDYKTYQSPAGMAHQSESDIYYIDYTPNRARMYNAFNILMNQARTTILKAHRDNRVTFAIPLTPNLEMYHTVYINTSTVQAIGKVVSLTHFCEIADGNAYTELTIAFSRAFGTPVDTSFTPPSPPIQIPADPNWNIQMSSIYGEEPAASFKGFVGNRWKTEDNYTYGSRGTNTFKTSVQERFITKAPDIGAEYRNLLQLNSSSVYYMSIPNYFLTVNFL